ncbi:MAG: SCO family protein [Gammaproteobacteria bacterium]|nr:SCO family protein [Gammaproteobacteria bacterium]
MHLQPTRYSGKSLPFWLLGLLGLLGLALIIAGALLSQRVFYNPPPVPEMSPGTTRLEPPRVLQDFAALDHRGRTFTLAQLRDHWTFMFFGYTHCPDICPTTLSTLNAVARKIAALPNTPPTPQYVFVSIDPERDTPELLAKFVPYFNPDFIGVTGTPAAIDALAKQLSVLYLKVESERPDGYLMDHSAALLLIDPQGRLHALMSPPFDTNLMAQDFQKLSHYYEAIQ